MQLQAVVAWQLERRLSSFIFTSRAFDPSYLRSSFSFPPVCVRVSTFLVFSCFCYSFLFMFELLPSFFALIYMYRVPAQSEHMLDPHCLYSPVAGSSLAISALFEFFSCNFYFFLLFVFESLDAFFCFSLQCYVTLFYVRVASPLFVFYLHVPGTGLNLNEHIIFYTYILHWVLLAVSRTVLVLPLAAAACC